MKRTVIAILAVFVLLLGLALAHGAKGKEVTLKGEVIDLQCYLVHSDSSQGADHAKCAQACLRKGLPAGLLTDDGTLYVLLGPSHDSASELVADHGGSQVTVKGVVTEQNGVKALQIKTVSAE